MASGIEWFPLETNLLVDDDKVFDLMDGRGPDLAFADLGRFVALLCRIYRDGPGLRINRRMARRIAHDLEMGVEEFEGFVARCVSAALFNARLWQDQRVLTSHGIQMRWLKAKGRSRSQGLTEEYAQWSLLDGSGEEDEDLAGLLPEPSGTPCAGCHTGCQVPSPLPAASAEGSPCQQCRLTDSAGLSSDQDRDMGGSRQLTDSPSLSIDREGDAGGFQQLTGPENSPLDKTRRDKKRREKRDQSVSLSGGMAEDASGAGQSASQEADRDTSALVPRCMVSPRGDDSCFCDAAGAPHQTPYGALEARYEARTGRRDFARLMSKVHGMCPGACRASPADVSECYALLSSAIDKADPAKGSPWALVRHVLASDRGPRHG